MFLWFKKYTTPIIFVVLLILFHFIVLYYNQKQPLTSSKYQALDLKRYEEAMDYLLRTPPNISNPEQANTDHFLVFITSKFRDHIGFRYLTQTIASAHYGLSHLPQTNFEIIVLVDGSSDFSETQQLPPNPYSVIYNMVKTTENVSSPKYTQIIMYLEALKLAAIKINERETAALLILEDDAISTRRNWRYVRDICLGRNIFDRNVKLTLIRLFYPEKYSNYSIELHCLLELAALVGLIVYFGWAIGRKSIIVFTLALLMDSAILVGRPTLEKLRLAHSDLLRLLPSPGCCIPAVLMRPDIERLNEMAHFIHGKFNSNLPIDLIIDRFAGCEAKTGYISLTTEPNLFYHIGYSSNFKTGRNVEEFINNPKRCLT